MKKRILAIFLALVMLASVSSSALAETYYFQVPSATIQAFWNNDGTLSLDYVWVFTNDSSDPIEYVDLGLPNSNFDIGSIYADVDGKPISVSQSEYQGDGSGVALVLGVESIPNNQSATVHAHVGVIKRVIYPDDNDENYVSAVFAPTFFGSSYVHGNTDLTMVFHLPPDIQSQEPRWHQPPSGFPDRPETAFDSEGRITYTWRNANADSSSAYKFGASFPKQYVPEDAVVRVSFFEMLIGGIVMAVGSAAQCCGPLFFVGLGIGIPVLSVVSDRKRRKQYLPPKISIEGHGIKRGLTAVEAAILMEQPIDSVLTMILFALIKKSAAEVVTRDPLEIKPMSPEPEDLRGYEKEFLAAFELKGAERRRAMQTTTVNLIKSVTEKMKGFSSKETIEYYKSITQKAWAQVEAANTPEVKSQKFDEVMEWTMLDRDFNDRTRDVFRHQPVFVPMWWGRFDPGFERRSPMTVPSSSSRPMPGPGGPLRVPGSEFASSIVTGIEGFAGGVIGNVTDFTNRVVGVTNPLPKTSSGSGGYRSGGGGGHSCACACACAGCACACAGGGR